MRFYIPGIDAWMYPQAFGKRLWGLCLYYPGRRHVPSSLRALIEFIRELKTKSPSS